MSVLVGKQAPDFTVPAVLGDGQIVDSFSFSEATRGKYAVVFFYPLDFTFVCPTEIIEFGQQSAEFSKRNAQVLGMSTDSQYSHLAWREQHPGLSTVRQPHAGHGEHQSANDQHIEQER